MITTQIAKKQLDNMGRNSSVELFRILSMLLVLIVHLNGIFVGLDPHELNFHNGGQVIIESVAIICVNCFLFISGFYGIRFKWKSLWNLYICLIGIKIPFWTVRCVFKKAILFSELPKVLMPLTSESYFINGYVLLMFLSPVLNAFIDSKGKAIWKYALLLFAVEFWFDCIRNNSLARFAEGYSVLHFIVVYFLARACNLNKEWLFKLKKSYWLLIWLASTVLTALQIHVKVSWCLSYTNPTIILSSAALFMFFAQMVFHSNNVNWIAKSVFAVYIVHLTSPVTTPFIEIDRYLLKTQPYGFYLLSMFGLAIAMLGFSIFYDKLRILFSERFTDKIYVQISRFIRSII